MRIPSSLQRLLAVPLLGILSVCLAADPAPPAAGSPTAGKQAYTADHRFLVRLSSVPAPIPMEKYFSVQLTVYDGDHPQHRLSDAQLQVAAGMTHGMTAGFAHEMPSSPQVAAVDGVATVSGMFFTMAGDWTLRITVHQSGHEGTVDFLLPCCED